MRTYDNARNLPALLKWNLNKYCKVEREREREAWKFGNFKIWKFDIPRNGELESSSILRIKKLERLKVQVSTICMI